MPGRGAAARAGPDPRPFPQTARRTRGAHRGGEDPGEHSTDCRTLYQSGVQISGRGAPWRRRGKTLKTTEKIIIKKPQTTNRPGPEPPEQRRNNTPTSASPSGRSVRALSASHSAHGARALRTRTCVGTATSTGTSTGTRVGTGPAARTGLARVDMDRKNPLRHDPRRLSPGFLVVHSGSAGAVAENAKGNAGGDGALQTPLPALDQGL